MFEAAVTAHLPLGPCALYASATGVVAVRLGEVTEERGDGAGQAAAIVREASLQLQAYLDGKLRSFDLPVDLSERTDFHRGVLQARIIPCHRSIGSSGRLVGYGHGLDVKQELLRMEQEQRGWCPR